MACHLAVHAPGILIVHNFTFSCFAVISAHTALVGMLAIGCEVVSIEQLTFKHLLGSLHSCLAQDILPAITMPSHIMQIAMSVDWKHAIRCAVYFLVVCLWISFIHLINTNTPTVRPESHSTFLFSSRASGLYEVSTYLMIIEMALYFTMDIPLRLTENSPFSFHSN